MTTHELDLHGYTWTEAQEEFIDLYNHLLEQTEYEDGLQLTVIHGYGSTGEGGVIRKRLRMLLERLSDHLEFTPGEALDGNQGCTVITPRERIPDLNDSLSEAIWAYCERPKAQSKIMGKFRRHGDPMVKGAIKALEKRGRWNRGNQHGRVVYQSSQRARV